jgi:hypothetical protein
VQRRALQQIKRRKERHRQSAAPQRLDALAVPARLSVDTIRQETGGIKLPSTINLALYFAPPDAVKATGRHRVRLSRLETETSTLKRIMQ